MSKKMSVTGGDGAAAAKKLSKLADEPKAKEKASQGPAIVADSTGSKGGSEFRAGGAQLQGANQVPAAAHVPVVQNLALFANAELQVTGRVVGYDPATKLYQIETGFGDQAVRANVQIGPKTNFETQKNLGGEWQGASNVLPAGTLITASGVLSNNDTVAAVTVKVQGATPNEYNFEKADFMATRLQTHADSLIAENFGMGKVDQSSMLGYRTYTNKEGDPVPQKTDQDGAVFSRTLYGLANNALINGDHRSLDVVREMVEYQRRTFAYRPQGEDYQMWYAVARPKLEADGTVKLDRILPSQNPEDYGQIPLYEQVYMLAGLTNYFNATRDPETLKDITATLRGFWQVWHDPKSDGFISHLDPKTMKQVTDGPNANQINWNSTGDFGPAMLRSLITALGPTSTGPNDPYNEPRKLAMDLLQKTSQQIIDHFPQKDGKPVVERFDMNWGPRLDHPVWQEDRAVMGHNAKIAWNLSSYGALYRRMAETETKPKEKERLLSLAQQSEDAALKLGKLVIEKGVNQATGGIFDIVERDPNAKVPFTWGTHTDWWQQEQLVLMAASLLPVAKGEDRALMLETLRRAETFYTTNFSNHEQGADYFRVGANGQAVTDGEYGNVTGHSKGFYHSSELYTLLLRLNAAYVTNGKFTQHFELDANRKSDSISVLPDFFAPGSLKVASVRVNGETLKVKDPENFTIELPRQLKGKPVELEVIYQGAGAEAGAQPTAQA